MTNRTESEVFIRELNALAEDADSLCGRINGVEIDAYSCGAGIDNGNHLKAQLHSTLVAMHACFLRTREMRCVTPWRPRKPPPLRTMARCRSNSAGPPRSAATSGELHHGTKGTDGTRCKDRAPRRARASKR
jgi:hypothetical protein